MSSFFDDRKAEVRWVTARAQLRLVAAVVMVAVVAARAVLQRLPVTLQRAPTVAVLERYGRTAGRSA